jgi:hypothetical protein
MPPHFLPEEKEREVIDFLMNKHGREYIIKDIVEYTGVLLDRDSHRKLINAFPPKVSSLSLCVCVCVWCVVCVVRCRWRGGSGDG